MTALSDSCVNGTEEVETAAHAIIVVGPPSGVNRENRGNGGNANGPGNHGTSGFKSVFFYGYWLFL
jgi:hypothetical protein